MEQMIAANALKRLGRYDPAQPGCRLSWSMSGVTLRAALTELAVQITCDYAQQCPWMGTLVDGAPAARFPLKRGTHWYMVLAGMDDQIAHDIAIVRDTQPVPGDQRMKIVIERISLNGQEQPSEEKKLLIEFVGDSLTSGEGTVGPRAAEEWIMAYMSATHTYSQAACSELGAEGRWISLSGWGVHSSWDGDENCRIPRIYDQICGADDCGNAPYDFAQKPADLIVVNLGTNDAAPMARLKGRKRRAYRETFRREAQAFLEQIRRHNPDARILWAYGMCGRPLEQEIQQAVAAVRAAGDGKTDYLRLPLCRADEIGSRQHPGWAYHQRAAKVIVRYWRAVTAAV